MRARKSSLEITSLPELQNLQLSQFYRVSLADLVLLINTFEKLPLINLETNVRPPQHLKLSFCDIS